MAKTDRRSVCPVACTLDLLGDRWTLLVIRDLFAGKSHYHEFSASPERIATNILAERLKRLVQSGLVEARPSAERAGANSYQLSASGRALWPVLVAIRDFGLEHIAGTRVHIHPKPDPSR